MLRFSAIWALLTGLTLAVMEVRANWGDWQWWPFWLIDFVAATLLLLGGIKTLREPYFGKPWLTAGWAFTFAMAWMSLGISIAAGPDPDRDLRLAGFYIALIGALLGSSLLGLVCALAGKAKPIQSKL